MTETTATDSAAQASRFRANHAKNRGNPQFFYPCSGIGNSAAYTVQIIRYDDEVAKHTVNGNPKPCTGPGCDWCRSGVKVTYSQRFVVRVVEDHRNNADCQQGRVLRWDMGPELAEIIDSGVSEGIDFARTPFRLIIHRRGDSTRPYYGCSRFLVPEPDPFADLAAEPAATVTATMTWPTSAATSDGDWRATCDHLRGQFNDLAVKLKEVTDAAIRLPLVDQMLGLAWQVLELKAAHDEPATEDQLKSQKWLRDERTRLLCEIQASKN